MMTRRCPRLLSPPPSWYLLLSSSSTPPPSSLPWLPLTTGSSPLLAATPGASNGTELAVAMVALTVFRKDIIWVWVVSYPGTNNVITRVILNRIFRSVLVGISRHIPYRYQRKSCSVHFGIIFFGGNPFFPQKGGTGPLFEGKRGHWPFFDTTSPLLRKKGVLVKLVIPTEIPTTQLKSDTSKIPIPKKLLVTP